MGRTKGSKNTQGHKAGGKRAGSGRKPRHPRNTTVHVSPNRTTVVLDKASPNVTALGNGTAGPSDETQSPNESEGEGFVEGAINVEAGDAQEGRDAPQPDAASSAVTLDDVHPDLRQLVQAGRSLPHDIPIVSFLYQGSGHPPMPLNSRAFNVMLTQMQAATSTATQPSISANVAVDPSAPSQVEQQHYHLQDGSADQAGGLTQDTDQHSIEPQTDGTPSPPKATHAPSTPTMEGLHNHINFNLLALPPASLVAQLPATPDDIAPGGKRKRRRCVVCLDEGEPARAYLCPGRGNRAACPLAKARLAKNPTGEPSSSANANKGTSSSVHPSHFTHPFPMAQLLSGAFLPLGGSSISLTQSSSSSGTNLPAWGYHKNGTARVRRPRRCRICVERGLDGTLCLGRQTKEKCQFYVKGSAEDTPMGDSGGSGMDESYEEEDDMAASGHNHGAVALNGNA